MDEQDIRKSQWNRWFAWFPVTARTNGSRRKVIFKFVLRRKVVSNINFDGRKLGYNYKVLMD